MNRTVGSLCSLGIAGISSLALLAPSAAYAAETGATGQASALRLTLGGTSLDSGRVVARTGEPKTGETAPLLGVLGGQSLISAGVLAQDAAADDEGTSAACAGVAGDGGTPVEIGDTGCIEPGDNLQLTLAELDLSGLTAFDQSSALSGLNALTQPILQALTPVLGDVQAALRTLTAQLGDVRLTLDAESIQARCTYDGETASGTTTLVGAGIHLRAGDAESPLPAEPLLDLTSDPGPNSDLATGLQDVVDELLGEAESTINNVLNDQGVLFTTLIAPVRTALVDRILDQIASNLAPVQENLLEVTLNQQSPGTDGSLDVTAVHVDLLPAAHALGAPHLLSLDLASVGCGPAALAPGDGDPTDPTDPVDPTEPVDEPDPEVEGEDTAVPVTDPAGDPTTPVAPDAVPPVTDSAGNPVPTAVAAGVGGIAGLSVAQLLGILVGSLAAAGAAAVARYRRIDLF